MYIILMRIPRDPKCLQGKIHDDQILPGRPSSTRFTRLCSVQLQRYANPQLKSTAAVVRHRVCIFRKLTPQRRASERINNMPILDTRLLQFSLHPRSHRLTASALTVIIYRQPVHLGRCRGSCLHMRRARMYIR